MPDGDDTLRLRVLFAADPDDEARVRSLIGQALSAGRLRVQTASDPTRPTTPRD